MIRSAEIPSLFRVPIVILSDQPSHNERQLCFDAGVYVFIPEEILWDIYSFIYLFISLTYRDKYLTKPLNKVVLCAVLEELAAERDGGRRSNSVTEGRSTSLAHSPTSPPSLQAARLEQVERVLSVFVPKEFQVRSRNFFPYWPSLSSPPFSFKYRNW